MAGEWGNVTREDYVVAMKVNLMILDAITMAFVVTIMIRNANLLVVKRLSWILEGYLVAPSDYFVTPVYSLMIPECLTPSKHHLIVNIRRCYMLRYIQKQL